MKKPTTKSQPKQAPHIQKSIVFVYALVVALILVIAVMALLLKVVRDDARMHDGYVFRQNTISSVTGLSTPAVIEPQAQKQSLYEMRVNFPIEGENDHLSYAYMGEYEGSVPAYAEVTTQSLMRAAKSVLYVDDDIEEVVEASREFAKCVKPFVVSYEPEFTLYADFTQVGSKPLANGRTLYIFKGTSCKIFEGATEKDEIQALQQQLLQAESY